MVPGHAGSRCLPTWARHGTGPQDGVRKCERSLAWPSEIESESILSLSKGCNLFVAMGRGDARPLEQDCCGKPAIALRLVRGAAITTMNRRYRRAN